jgi:IS5 family transposase
MRSPDVQQLRHASGNGERDGALDMLTCAEVKRGATLGADKGYDTQGLVAALKQRGIRPHIAHHTKGRHSAIDGRAARGNGYAMSPQIRKRIEQGFGLGQDDRRPAQTTAGVAVRSTRLGDLDVRSVQPNPTWWHR